MEQRKICGKKKDKKCWGNVKTSKKCAIGAQK
jgi:hypothetical protein